MDICWLGCSYDLVHWHRSTGVSIGNVVFDGGTEQHGLLRHDGNISPWPLNIKVFYQVAIYWLERRKLAISFKKENLLCLNETFVLMYVMKHAEIGSWVLRQEVLEKEIGNSPQNPSWHHRIVQEAAGLLICRCHWAQPLQQTDHGWHLRRSHATPLLPDGWGSRNGYSWTVLRHHTRPGMWLVSHISYSASSAKVLWKARHGKTVR